MLNYEVNIQPLKPYSRSVSIIGVGATPFMMAKDHPETKGLSEGELFGHAAIEAMKDAGITAKDVDFYIHAQAGPGWQSNFGTPNMHVANWFGMKGKGSCHHSEACCTGYVALEQAVSYVASGTYDIVLTGACDMSYSAAYPDKPIFMRRNGTDQMFNEALCSVQPRDYTLFSRSGPTVGTEGWLDNYIVDNGISDEEVDDFLTKMAINARKMASMNPLSVTKNTYEDMAKKFRMNTAEEFLHSRYNPKMGKYLRASHFEQRCDGAAALIVCPTEMAHKFTDKPVEVLGIGHSCLEWGTPYLEWWATRAAYKQVSDLTGLKGSDMDLLMTNDFWMTSQLLAAEACEYLPENEGWTYFRDERTTFEGDRPINTNGGRCQYGHAHGTSGIHDHVEAVRQMRGEMGATQIKRPIKHAMLRGFGGGQNLTCAMLRYNG